MICVFGFPGIDRVDGRNVGCHGVCTPMLVVGPLFGCLHAHVVSSSSVIACVLNPLYVGRRDNVLGSSSDDRTQWSAQASRLTPASHQIYQTMANPNKKASAPMVGHGQRFSAWRYHGTDPLRLRGDPLSFMSARASRSCTAGIAAKLYTAGGDAVVHSRVRPFHGSPVRSRLAWRFRMLTTS